MMSLLEHEVQRHALTSSRRDIVSHGAHELGLRIHSALVGGRVPAGEQQAKRPTPGRHISCVTLSDSGSHYAAADRMGNVWLAARGEDAASTYAFHVGKRCYTSVIDPLNSVEVTPVVQRMAFLPQLGPTLQLLTTNEKVPKLYKVMSVRQTPPMQKAVSLVGSKLIGPLTSPQGIRTVAMKQVCHYALDHEYTIHSVCLANHGEGQQFFTSDDISVRLWCVEYPTSSVEVYSLKKEHADGAARELLRRAVVMPCEPSLLFLCTTGGSVRVVDVRESMRWSDRDVMTFTAPSRSLSDGPFAEITSAISSAALSPCGRYLAARDFLSVPLWDIRRGSSSPSSGSSSCLGRHEIHAHLLPQLDALYQADLLLERYDVMFANSTTVVTGGLNSTVCTIDLSESVAHLSSSASVDSAAPGVRHYRVSASGTPHQAVRVVPTADGTSLAGDTGRVTCIGSSGSNSEDFVVSCGGAVVHMSL